MDDESAMLAVGKTFTVILVPVFLIVFAAAWVDKSEPHIILDKDKWQCTHSHTVLVPTLVGKLVLSMPQDVCDEYSSKERK